MNNSDKNNCLEEMADFFNQRAEGYDEHMKNVAVEDFSDFYKTIGLPIRDTDKNISVLDLGCGTGLEIEGILKKAPNASIKCVDLSHEMLSKLKEKYLLYADNITLVEGSYLEFEYKPTEYDLVVSAMTMHHLERDAKLKLYKSIHSSLKEGACYIEGDYVVSKDQEETILDRYLDLKKTYPEIANGSYHVDIPFSRETQLELFEDAGFSGIETIWERERSVIFVAHK